MEGELESENLKFARLQLKLKEARKKNEDIQQEIRLFEQASTQGVFYLEVCRAKKITVWWLIFTLMPLICMFGTKGVVTPGLNFFAFLCMWRGLYVQINRVPFFISIMIVICTIKFG